MTSKDIKPVIEQPDTEIPLMLSQAIIVSGVLAVGELACSPLYFSLLKASLALIPWAMEAVFMAVAFLFAKLLDVKLGNRKTTAIIMLVMEVAAAIIGLIIMILMFRALYAA